MAEYIERDALLKEMLSLHTIPDYIGHVTDEDVMFETMVDVVKEYPTADVVEVVRCCNCTHLKTDTDRYNYCEIHSSWAEIFYVRLTDYCSCGERR